MELKLKKEKEKNAVEAAEDEVVIITELPMVMKGQKNPHKIIKVRSLEYRESLNNADYGESKYRFKRKTMLIRDKWFWQMGVMDNFSYPLCNRIEPRSSVSRMQIFIVDFSHILYWQVAHILYVCSHFWLRGVITTKKL